MNPLIITIIIALATFILSIFTANWLNQQHVNKLMERQDKRIEDLKIYLDARFDGVRQEISSVRIQVENLGTRIDRIERQLDQIFKPSLPR